MSARSGANQSLSGGGATPGWDARFARDRTAALLRAFAQTVDGQFQTFSANDGAYNRERFFGQSPELAALATHLSDDTDRLGRGIVRMSGSGF